MCRTIHGAFAFGSRPVQFRNFLQIVLAIDIYKAHVPCFPLEGIMTLQPARLLFCG